MKLVGPFNSGAAVGGAGVATANTDSTIRLCGLVYAVYVKYNDSPPAGTTDVTIKTKGTSPDIPSYNILVLTNAATDGLYPVRVGSVSTAGAALLYAASGTAVSVLIPIDDFINVTIAGANSGDSADVWFMLG